MKRLFLGALLMWMSTARAYAGDLNVVNSFIELTKVSKIQVKLELHDVNQQCLVEFCKAIAEKLGNCHIQIRGDASKTIQSTSKASGEIEAKHARELLGFIQKNFIDTNPSAKWELDVDVKSSKDTGTVRLKICRAACD